MGLGTPWRLRSSRTRDRTCVSRIGRLTSNLQGSPVVIFSCSYTFLDWEKLVRGCAACQRRMVVGWRQDAWHSRIIDKLIKSARKLAFQVFLRVAEKKQNVSQERFQWSSEKKKRSFLNRSAKYSLLYAVPINGQESVVLVFIWNYNTFMVLPSHHMSWKTEDFAKRGGGAQRFSFDFHYFYSLVFKEYH